jgi:hypothetical protein
MYYVSYIHLAGYRVRRSFPTLAKAQEFIDVNAMVQPLPGVRLYSEADLASSVSTPWTIR